MGLDGIVKSIMGLAKRAATDVKEIAQFILLILTGVLIVIIVRTATYGPAKLDITPCKKSDVDHISIDVGHLDRFKKALQIQTISWDVGRQNDDELQKLIDFITEAFPLVHSSPHIITREIVGNYSLLYTVNGTDPSLQPYMLNGHMDVVPVAADRWDYPPFGATEEDGYIYARGTIDDKHQVIGLLETLEYMLANGIQPKRSFYVGFGHDEEILGYNGAQQISKLLKARGVKLAFVHDEGMAILDGIIPGAQKPIAYVGTSEKGWLVVKVSVNMTGGHSSMPPLDHAISVLSEAVNRLERNPQPHQFGKGDEKALFEHIAHTLSLPQRVVMSNLWLFAPLVVRKMSVSTPFSNSLIRTTTCVTMFNAGIKPNVISPYAEAIVNHRIHPGQTVQEVLQHDKEVINDPRVNVEVVSAVEASPSSPHGEDSFGYQVVKTSIMQVWDDKDVVVAPGLLIGGTDTRWYQGLTDSIYRISPSYLGPDDPPRFHGVNERISVDNYERVLNFYLHLIKNADDLKVPMTHTHGSDL